MKTYNKDSAKKCLSCNTSKPLSEFASVDIGRTNVQVHKTCGVCLSEKLICDINSIYREIKTVKELDGFVSVHNKTLTDFESFLRREE
jgi:hypothetical protein